MAAQPGSAAQPGGDDGEDPLFDDIDYALHLARARRRMSQREFAEMVGLSKSRLARLEQGEGLQPLRLLQRVLAAAGFRLTVVDTQADEWDAITTAGSSATDAVVASPPTTSRAPARA